METLKSVNGSAVAGIHWVRRSDWPAGANRRSRAVSVVDLFCGCGGLTLGVWEAVRVRSRRLDVRLAVDLEERPLEVYRKNFDQWTGQVRQDDVARLFDGRRLSAATRVERYWMGRLKPIDLIVAGPPCQGHSDLNNTTRRNDPRNALYLRVIRAVEILRPKALIVENVPAVLLDKRGVVQRAVSWLRRLDYSVSERVVGMMQFGVPQLRRRHILVATRTKEFCLSDLDRGPNLAPTAGDFLAGLEDEADEDGALFCRPARMTPENRRRVAYLFSKDLYDLPNSKRPSCHRDKKHAYVSMYGRMHWDRPAQTLTSGFGSMGQGRYVHPTRRRLISPHEAARLQGFPDFFDFSPASSLSSLREMIANAVPPQFTAQLVTKFIDEGVL